MNRKLYARLATALQARANCAQSGKAEWPYTDRIIQLVAEYMPTGSGIDGGVKFDLDKSKPNRLVFRTAFHHMDKTGSYDGWTEHTVTVTPCLSRDFDLKISGRNRNGIKDYLADEVFSCALSAEVPDNSK